jgi:hypothetical protein
MPNWSEAAVNVSVLGLAKEFREGQVDLLPL